MTTDLDTIDVEFSAESQDEKEYQEFVARLQTEKPPVSLKTLDFSKLLGNLNTRSVKAIVLHLTINCGWSILDIADILDVKPSMANRYLTEAIGESFPLENVEIVRKFELLKLDALERFSKDCAKRSTEDAEIVTEELDPLSPERKMVVTKRVRKGQSGNPGWARVLTEIQKHRDRLLGLAEPKRVEVDKTEKRLIILKPLVVESREEAEAARAAGLLNWGVNQPKQIENDSPNKP